MDEIRRLRRKFILTATLAVVIIVTVALGLINAMAYVRMQEEVDDHLTMISENDGHLPNVPAPKRDTLIDEPDWYNDSPESHYQMRYFSVLMTQSGELVRANLNNIASFGKLDVQECIKEVLASKTPKGTFKRNRAHYSYQITEPDSTHYLLVVLDTTRDYGAVEQFMRYSFRFGLICVVIYALILIGICNIIIRPFINNMQNQKRFITNASHELKTPIAIISANAEAMELLQGKSEWTTNILTQVKRLTHLINDLITLAKMGERTRKDLKLTEVNVSGLLDNSVESFRPLVLDDNGKKIEAQIEPNVVAKTEEKSLYEIFNILMDNAVKYCDPNGTITAALSKSGRHGFKVSVSNSYAAGANKDYTHFFERFYRGDTSHSTGTGKVAGYGIGLSMARDLTELLKGSIKVSFKDGIITYTVQF
ncbi:MAG: HAMP domain-containing histidine kinase [Acidaminococcus sp.]|jgi:signal transduction histidine kinase|nr:HAMP domain-containing histidine kinase [Acidaminococcus sp.]MCI2099510.1 HAMP domain-containing histidine kinase [Acidaminococcus sp.]MCI2113871.1 HAMP domain-containing histidine kinase [Acidaminococcus sp.]MCI2115556.1 HAMP domain-containing histidine kinase [Acidaminococcus sp.]